MTDQTQSSLPIDVAQPDADIAEKTPAERALIVLNSSKTETDLLALVEKNRSIKEIKDKAGRDQAHGALMELVRARTTITTVGKDARDDATKFSKAVIAEEKRLTDIVAGEERRLKGLRDEWDAEQERIKAEELQREIDRVKGLKARIQEIKDLSGLAMQCRSSERVQALKDRLAAINLDNMQEFAAQADTEKSAALEVVESILDTRIKQEAEAARMKAEREELERQQAEAKKREDEQRVIAESLAADRAALERERAAFEAAKAPKPEPAAPVNSETCCENGPPGGVCDECAETSAAYQEAMRPVRDVDLIGSTPISGDDSISVGAIYCPDFSRPVFGNTKDFGVVTLDAEQKAPSASALINAIADRFTVSSETACQWLCERADDFEVWQADEETTETN